MHLRSIGPLCGRAPAAGGPSRSSRSWCPLRSARCSPAARTRSRSAPTPTPGDGSAPCFPAAEASSSVDGKTKERRRTQCSSKQHLSYAVLRGHVWQHIRRGHREPTESSSTAPRAPSSSRIRGLLKETRRGVGSLRCARGWRCAWTLARRPACLELGNYVGTRREELSEAK